MPGNYNGSKLKLKFVGKNLSSISPPKSSTKSPFDVSSVISKYSLVAPSKNILKEIPPIEYGSGNVESSTPIGLNQKEYSTFTSLPETEPTIVLSSEFVSLFSGNEKTFQGNALSLKESARLATSKVATAILVQNQGAISSSRSNSNELSRYISQENEFLVQLVNSVNSTMSFFDIGTFSIFNNSQYYRTFYDILKTSGYNNDDIKNFSITKLWYQSLIETKKSILTHTPGLLSQRYSRPNNQTDKDAFALSDLTFSTGGQKKVWFNFLRSSFDIKPSDLSDDSKSEEIISRTIRFDDAKYFDLNSNTILPDSFFKTYQESSRDISIVSNFIFKEIAYSRYFYDYNNTKFNRLKSRYGYDQPSNGNFLIWDFVVGKFPNKSFDLIVNPTGNGRSLSSFAQSSIPAGNVGTNYYNVMTFENSFVEGYDVTPGTYYYVESSLNTTNGTSFDVTKLDSLISKTNEAITTTSDVFDIMGYDIQSINSSNSLDSIDEQYVTKWKGQHELSLNKLSNSFSVLYERYYKNALFIDQGYLKFNYEYVGDTPEYQRLYRVPSLICKLAVSPTKLYESDSKRIKALIYLMVMSKIVLDSNNSIRKISNYKTQLTSLLMSRESDIRRGFLRDAQNSNRTIPVSIQQTSDNTRPRDEIIDNTDEDFIEASSKKIFSIDISEGLWQSIVDEMKVVYSNIEIFNNEGNTRYSGISKHAFMYCYFDLILRMIASQTPENIVGSYKEKFLYRSTRIGRESTIVNESGLLIEDANFSVNSCFSVDSIRKNLSTTKILKKISSALDAVSTEEKTLTNNIFLYRKYLRNFLSSLSTFRVFLTNNFESHIGRINSLYSADENLNTEQRRALFNLAHTEGQINLTRYIMSEISDGLKVNSNQSKLRSIPIFSGFSSGFGDFLPLNEIEMSSYSMLSPYFKSVEFQNLKSNNKRILSIGIPPRLLNGLNESSRSMSNFSSKMRNGIVRINVFKVDRLHPDAVYLPKSFLFDMRRFPTRVIDNWEFSEFQQTNPNIFNIPTKLTLPSGQIALHRNYSEAFPENVYGNFLTNEEKYQMYSNHAISYLSEEYLRWFTDCRFDESRYYNYGDLTSRIAGVENQFLKYISTLSPAALNTSPIPPGNNPVLASFLDPVSGQRYYIPVSSPVRSDSQSTQAVQTNTQQDRTFVLDVDNTLKSYFSFETLLLDPVFYKRKISYPKKFDRVFNVIIDPDDFIVDLQLTNPNISPLINNGVIVGGPLVYKHRDTTTKDVSVEEYFVTIEPYDYAQQYGV